MIFKEQRSSAKQCQQLEIFRRGRPCAVQYPICFQVFARIMIDSIWADTRSAPTTYIVDFLEF